MKYVCLATLVIGVAVPALATAKGHSHSEQDMVRIDNASPPLRYLMMRDARARGGNIDVYLNPNGARITAGWENSARLTSGLVARRGMGGAVIPRYQGNRWAWEQLVRCVRERYAAFNINIHTKQPTGRYIMAMVGGSPSHLGYHGSVGGVAPFNGRVIDNAIVFVFDRNWRNTESMCNTVVHEVGHALGLEHQYLCKDPMSYLRGCGKKTFQDSDAWCGEFQARRCHNGGTQNSYRHLARVLGLRHTEPEPDPDTNPDPDTDPDVDEDPDPEPEPPIARRPQPNPQRPNPRPRPPRSRADTMGPSVSIVSPRATLLAGDSIVQIVVHASDPSGIADVQLGWSSPQQRWVLQCSNMPSNLPVSCQQRGSYYVFSLRVGYGERSFAVRVVDGAGNATITNPTDLSFDD